MDARFTGIKVAVDTLTAMLKDAYTGIAQPNKAITNLVAQRDDFVKKFNDEVKDGIAAKSRPHFLDLNSLAQRRSGGDR